MTKTQFIAEPGRQEIVVTRVYDAPRKLVFKAYTDPNSVPQWWGPSYLTTTVDKMDIRQGGIWRFVQHAADGNAHFFQSQEARDGMLQGGMESGAVELMDRVAELVAKLQG